MHSHVSLGTTEELEGFLVALEGLLFCRVIRDDDAGTADAFDDADGGTNVLRAIQKGEGGPWIMGFTDSKHVKWSKPTQRS